MAPASSRLHRPANLRPISIVQEIREGKMKKTLYLACVLLILLTGCQSKATPTPFVGTGTAQLGDITMYFEGAGTGKPLLLLGPGFWCADFWANKAELYSQTYNVITPEARGMCRTTGMDGEVSYHMMAEDMIKLMDYLGIDKAAVVGSGDGAISGLDMASNHSDHLSALVSLGPIANPQSMTTEILDILKTSTVEGMRDFWASAEYQSKLPEPGNLDAFVEKYINMMLTEPNFTDEQLGSIKTPTMIVSGETDWINRVETYQELVDKIPNAQLTTLGPATPDILDMAPDKFNEAVLEFLKDK
ncbi:MAG: alpha/beta hydrolase [Anaerolineae bacterium]|nr:alpha/beta hydrolase [Anaerolineae bacterium]